jgi:hypothetical protein
MDAIPSPSPLFAHGMGMAGGTCAAFVLCGMLYLLLKAIFGLYGWERSWLAGCVAVLAFPFATVGLTFWMAGVMPHEGRGVTVEEANRHIRWFQLPPTALNVSFSTGLHKGVDVDFEIEEAAFLAWAHDHGWATDVFQRDADWPMNIDGWRYHIPTDARFGFYFSEAPGGRGRDLLFGYFDHDTGRARVRYYPE